MKGGKSLRLPTLPPPIPNSATECLLCAVCSHQTLSPHGLSTWPIEVLRCGRGVECPGVPPTQKVKRTPNTERHGFAVCRRCWRIGTGATAVTPGGDNHRGDFPTVENSAQMGVTRHYIGPSTCVAACTPKWRARGWAPRCRSHRPLTLGAPEEHSSPCARDAGYRFVGGRA